MNRRFTVIGSMMMQSYQLVVLVMLLIGAASLHGAAASDRRLVSVVVAEVLDKEKLQALLAEERMAKEHLLAVMAAHHVHHDQAGSNPATKDAYKAHLGFYSQCVGYLYRCGHSKIKAACDELNAAKKGLARHRPDATVFFGNRDVGLKNLYQMALVDVAEQQMSLDRAFEEVVRIILRK